MSEAPADPAAMLADLERRLAATPRAARPLEHASLRYAVGLGYAELPSGDHAQNLARAVREYQEAAKLFGPHRHPVEHARVLTALAAAQRELGRSEEALRTASRAVDLLEDTDALGDLGAALNNLGLARSDLGDHGSAVGDLRRAVKVFAEHGEPRQQAMAAHNLGQTQSAAGQHRPAVVTYRDALAVTDPQELPYHWALLQHALGVALTALGDAQHAATAFSASLQVFTQNRYPFQYALAKNNLGLAYAQSDDITALRRAVAAYSDALRMLDPRVHKPQWEQAYRNLELAEQALADRGSPGTRAEHLAALLASVDDDERIALLRERVADYVDLPEPRRTESLAELDLAVLGLDEDAARAITGAWLRVLMEMPNEAMMVALRARMAAHQHLPDDAARQMAAEHMEDAIRNELLSPQRIRVHEALATMGYERP